MLKCFWCGRDTKNEPEDVNYVVCDDCKQDIKDDEES